MKTKQEYTGKDVDEAINRACAALDVSREDLTIEVLSPGSAGIFGLCRRKAVIRATRKHDDPVPTAVPAPPEKSGKRKTRATVVMADNGDELDEDQAEPANNDKIVLQLSTEMKEALREDLLKLLDLMEFPSQVEVTEKAGKANAHISGDFVGDIVGAEGHVLDNLQYLLRKMLSKKFNQKIVFTLDAGDYRSTRSDELAGLAVKLAETVKATGKSKTIPALNPSERRIVHMALQNDSSIRSRSVGDGLFKKILIYLPGSKGKKKPESKRRGGRGKRKPSEKPDQQR